MCPPCTPVHLRLPRIWRMHVRIGVTIQDYRLATSDLRDSNALCSLSCLLWTRRVELVDASDNIYSFDDNENVLYVKEHEVKTVASHAWTWYFVLRPEIQPKHTLHSQQNNVSNNDGAPPYIHITIWRVFCSTFCESPLPYRCRSWRCFSRNSSAMMRRPTNISASSKTPSPL